MNFRFCFCCKRNRASYNISSEKISYANSNGIISTITSPTLPSSSDSSGNQHIDTNNEYLTPTTSMGCNGHTSIISKRLSQPLLEDYSELYATVDKTRRAKNSIRKNPDTNFPGLTTTTLRQPISSLNPYSSEHPPRTVSLYGNIPVNMRTNNHDHISSRRRTYHNEVKARESFFNRDQCLKIEEEQTRPNSSRTRERDMSGGSDLYAEIVNGSTSCTIYPNGQSNLHSPLLNGNETDDTTSERYATIK